MKHTRIDWIVVAIAIFVAAGGCAGGCGGCAGMEPIPGGFPAASRTPNAGQIRVTPTAIAAITADPAAVIGPLAGAGSMNGVINFNVPGSCGSTKICCVNNQVQPNCGPLAIDLNKRTGDADRLVLTPVQGNSRVDMTIRARIKTLNPLPVTIQGVSCNVAIDTEKDNTPPDTTIAAQLALTQDTTTSTTRMGANNVNVSGIDDGDVTISGNFACSIADFFKGAFIGTLTDQIAGQIEDAVNDATCKSCTTIAECAPFGDACTNGTCMIGARCLQEMGLAGRMRGSSLFASLSPGTTGALDIYEVLGGYATTNNNGIALGMLGGMRPGGVERDRCGPPATAPASVTVPQSTFFQGNTRPDTNAAFDVGIGLHKSQLDALAYGGYDGGLFCLTVGSSTVAQLSTDTISLLSRSLGKLVESNSAMAVGLRPQAPPTIVLGLNTFKDEGGTMVPDEPLLDIKFTALEIDFFASIDDQYNRVFTVVADVHLPIGLQTTAMGELAPVIGNADMAFTNLSVKNSEAVTESPAELAGLFPTLLGLVLPQLSGGLSPIALPEIGGLALSVTDVTAVDNKSFLAIYANLVPVTTPRIVDTRVELEGIYEPPTEVANDPAQWRSAKPPSVRLNLEGNDKNLEFSWRTNAGAWSGWSQHRHPLVTVPAFWLPGIHKLEVRAREIGRPETIDREPVMIDLLMGTDVQLPSDRKPTVIGFHGQAGAAGCSCQTSSPTGGVLLAFVIAGLVLVPRRRKRTVRCMLRSAAYTAGRLGLVVWIAAILSLPGCSCGSNPCGDADCLPGAVEHGAGGRWTSIAGDSDRVMVATYDNVLGDLMAVDATNPSALEYTAVDGVPDETSVYDPGTYRDGIEGAGDDVGAWTSIAIEGGIARIAYQDRTAGTLKYANETKTGGSWESHVVDGGDVEAGQYASMVIDADKRPAIAYLALGVDDGAGHRNVELRIARAGNANPEASGDWTHAVIATAPGTCGGLCGGQSCVAGAAETDPQECVTATTDCATACADTEVCVTGACRAFVDVPKVVSLPGGTGLYVSLVVLPDGRLAAAYYDMTRRALVLAAEATRGGNDFAETVLDGNVAGRDRGMWATAVAGDDGVVHIGYQDSLGDQLMYTTWNGAAGTPEVVDNGVRAGDRPHPVGSGSSIYLDAGAPVIAYQDGLVSDAMLASRGTGTWASVPLAAGPLLDGFSIAATTGHGSPAIAWGSMDPALAIPMMLVVGSP